MPLVDDSCLDDLLLIAAAKRNYAEVESCIKAGASVNYQNFNYRTPLSLVCVKEKFKSHVENDESRLRIAKLLIDSGANVDQDFFEPQYSKYMTPLQAAVFFQIYSLIELLLNSNVNVNARDTRGEGFTALHWAVQDSDWKLSIVQRLLQVKNIDVNARCWYNSNTPLHLAMNKSNNESELIELLRTHGADLEAVNEDGRNPVQEYMANVMSFRTATCYFRGIEPAILQAISFDDRNSTRQHVASIFHRAKELEKLSQEEVNTCDGFGYTPLLCAVLARGPAKNKRRTIHTLLNRGAHVFNTFGADDEEGNYSILDVAILTKDNEISKILVQHITKLRHTTMENEKERIVDICFKLLCWTESLTDMCDLWKYYSDCEAEVAIMKKTKVNDTSFSLFQLITADEKTSRINAKRTSLVDAFEICMLNDSLPIYREMLPFTTFGQIIEHRRLVERASLILCDIFKFADHTNIFYEETLSYLDNEELKFLLESSM